MVKETLKNILIDLEKRVNEINYDGDLSDVGNEIGIILGEQLVKTDDDLHDVISGLKHGISLGNNTHP
jgi:hypothetical protein